MGKYDPLNKFLRQSPTAKREVLLSFQQIESILRDRLPVSSHTYRAWWGNELNPDRVQANAWISAGWVVDTVDLQNQWVRFTRT